MTSDSAPLASPTFTMLTYREGKDLGCFAMESESGVP